MAYIDENTRWRFTVPQAGEVDSAESVERMLVEIDDALIGPMGRAELVDCGGPLNPSDYVDGDTSEYSDEPDAYWSAQEGRPVYVTKRHFHPAQGSVAYADESGSSNESKYAERAEYAGYLVPGFRLNGKHITGKQGDDGSMQSTVIEIADIPDAPRVYWGASEPNDADIELPRRRGDIYVKIMS